MIDLKKQENEILKLLCKENGLNVDFLKKLLNNANKISYENATLGARKKEYMDLLTFYSKQDKGD